MSGALDGKVAVVVGAASGLGEVVATRAAAEGAHVVVADIDAAGAERVVKDITTAGGRATPCAVNVTREADVVSMVATAKEAGGVDLLVLSAAVETRASVVECDDDDWQRVIDVNLKGPFLCMKHAIPVMAAAGGGSVVALGSVLGAIVAPKYAAYCASKFALVNLCKQAAIEHARQGVRVNVVAPSATEAGLFLQVAAQAEDPEGLKKMVAANTPMGRLGTADDVWQTVLFLAGQGSSYISGTVIPLDGGMAARRM